MTMDTINGINLWSKVEQRTSFSGFLLNVVIDLMVNVWCMTASRDREGGHSNRYKS